MSRHPARIVAVGHFPPPVHGMAVAVDRLVRELEGVADVRRVNIGGPGLDRSDPRYHMVRVSRVIRGLLVLLNERRRCTTAFFSCDAGAGMPYTLALVVFARLMGYRSHLQHHSYAYVTRRSRVLATLVTLTRGRCVHLVSCSVMEADLRATYPAATTRVVGVAAGVGVTDEPRRRPPGDALVLGFLGNVTMDKGLGLALDTLRAVRSRGIPAELRIAGPVVDSDAEEALATAAADDTLTVRRVGPVDAAGRDAFLDGLDVFLFPSRYSHESFGLVAWEAMGRGVPLIAHRAGCLTADAVDGAGVVVDLDEDYVTTAVTHLVRWWHQPALAGSVGDAGRKVVAGVVGTSERQRTALVEDLATSVAAEQLSDRRREDNS